MPVVNSSVLMTISDLKMLIGRCKTEHFFGNLKVYFYYSGLVTQAHKGPLLEQERGVDDLGSIFVRGYLKLDRYAPRIYNAFYCCYSSEENSLDERWFLQEVDCEQDFSELSEDDLYCELGEFSDWLEDLGVSINIDSLKFKFFFSNLMDEMAPELAQKILVLDDLYEMLEKTFPSLTYEYFLRLVESYFKSNAKENESIETVMAEPNSEITGEGAWKTMGVLVELIKDNAEYRSDADIKTAIRAKYPNVRGISNRSLDNYFSKARKALSGQ